MHLDRVWFATLLCLTPAAAAPILLVVPHGQTNSPGNGINALSPAGGYHSQEVIDPAEFGGILGDVLITQFAVRAAPGTGPVSVLSPSFQIRLSASPFFPNSNGGSTRLTDTFAANMGPDSTLVYSGPLSLTSPGCPAGSVCPFDMVIAFTTPFSFHSSQGRLLFDLQTTNAMQSGALDAMSFTFPPGGSLASVNGPFQSPTGEVDAGGTVLQIGYTLATPEPGTLAMLLCGTTILLLLRRKQGAASGL